MHVLRVHQLFSRHQRGRLVFSLLVKTQLYKSEFQKQSKKWKVKCAYIQSMAFVSSKKYKDLSDCQQMKTCPSRHTKTCKRYASGSCRFQNECAYSHQNDHKLKDKCENTDKIYILEKIVREITFKFIKVDQELKVMKEQIKVLQTTVNNKVGDAKEREYAAEEKNT